MALDVLDLDDGVVHQDADHQGQRQQRDAVQRVAEPGHDREGGQDGQRQRDRRHQRGPPAAQEQEDDQHGQRGAFHQRHDGRVVAGQRVGHGRGHLLDVDVGVLAAQLFQGVLHALRDARVAGPLARNTAKPTTSWPSSLAACAPRRRHRAGPRYRRAASSGRRAMRWASRPAPARRRCRARVSIARRRRRGRRGRWRWRAAAAR